jgi:ribosomal protein L25 (general stress protein Ctc)
MWKAIETLTFKGPSGGFESKEHAIASISRKEIRCFRNNGEIYADIYGENDFEKIKLEPKVPKWLDIQEALGTTFYKKVIVKNGRYFGPHRTDFEYRIGEMVMSPTGPGLFCYTSMERAGSHSVWSGSFSEAILELRVENSDDIVFGDQITLKKALCVATHEIMKQAA